MWALSLVGLAFIAVAGIWGVRHPKRKGEPYGRARWIVTAIGLVGVGLAVIHLILSITN